MAPLTTVERALELVLARAAPLAAEGVAVERSAGRVLAADARSPVDLPLFPSSAMDGFAVRSADTPGSLPVVGRSIAGRPADRPLAPGEAMAIATGGVVPDGADAVIPLEDVMEHGDVVEVPAAMPLARTSALGAATSRVGALVQAAGSVITPAALAALAACGIASVSCGRRPRAAVLTTGTELRAPGEPLGPGEIYESNGPMLEAILRRAGCDVTRLHPVADDPEAHRASLASALDADVVVTSGGVSVGPHDLVRSTLASLGVEEVFWGVAMRPGKPLAFGTRGSTLVFGLPGNPVSSLVGATLFVVPAVRALQGASDPGPRYRRGTLAAAADRRPTRDDFVRASASPERAADAALTAGVAHDRRRGAGGRARPRSRRESCPCAAGSEVDYLPLDDRATGA